MSTDMIRFVEHEGWRVAVEGVGDPTEGRVLDVEAGEKLGYSRGRRFRQFIAALIKQGTLTGVYERTQVVRSSMPNGGTKEETVKQYWLTKEQLLIAAAKSTTPIAKQILDQMVQVFIFVQEKGMAAMVASTRPVSELQEKTEHLRQMQPYFEKAIEQIADLEAKGLIDATTASAHRTVLLMKVAGIDLTKAPMVRYENVQPARSQPQLTGSIPVNMDNLQGPGGLPATGINIKPTVSREGFMYAYELGELFGVSALIIGQLARGAGIYGKITPIKNEYGISYGVEHGVEGKTTDSWLYSEKSRDILEGIVKSYIADLPRKPKKDSIKRFAQMVGKAWKEAQPLEPATVSSPPPPN